MEHQGEPLDDRPRAESAWGDSARTGEAMDDDELAWRMGSSAGRRLEKRLRDADWPHTPAPRESSEEQERLEG